MVLALPAEGGCQCGENRYRIIGEPVWLAVCHCNDCKHQSGSAFGMSLRVRKADLEIIRESRGAGPRPPTAAIRKSATFAAPAETAFGTSPPNRASSISSPVHWTIDRSSVPRFEGWTKRKVGWLTIDGLEPASRPNFSVTAPGR
jgi:hypothetical protein